MKLFYKYCAFISMTFVSTNSFAAFVDSSPTNKPISVQEAQKKSDKTLVTLEGYILSKIGKEKYQFSDKKNEKNEENIICIEVENSENGKKIMPDKEFGSDQKIRIEGEIDKEFKPFGTPCKSIKIEIHSLTLLDK